MSVVLTKKDSLESSNKRTNTISSNKKNVIKKSSFEIECEKGFTIEESRKRVHDKIDSLWKK